MGSPAKAEVLRLVVVEEVAVASHPHIASNEDTDGVVHFPGLKIVVQQEQHLQPQRIAI